MPNVPDDQVVTFDAKTARRLIAAARWVEAQARAGNAPGPRRPPPWTPAVVRAYVTTAIPGGTRTSPSSSGRARILGLDGSTWYDLPGDPAIVWNDHTFCPGVTSIAVGKVVKLAWISGQWWLLGADS